MNNLNFEYLRAKNFLCFGPDGIEIDLTTMGNIILIQGKNYDDERSPGTNTPGSNGTGKSSVQEILVYAIYGQPVKRRLRQEDMIHTKIGKNCEVEVRWSSGSMKYRVIRAHKPNSLRLWESLTGVWDDTTEITAGAGIKETNRLIEARIGLNYRTFINVACFDDRNSTSFLECDAATKREIVENLLSLDKYREYNRVAKDYVKEAERDVKTHLNDYNRFTNVLDSVKVRVQKLQSQEASWKADREREVETIIERAKLKRVEMNSLDGGAKLIIWNEAQVQITLLTPELVGAEDARNKIEQKAQKESDRLLKCKVVHTTAIGKVNNLNEIGNRLLEELAAANAHRQKIIDMDGATCGECGQKIDADHRAQCLEIAEFKVAEIITKGKALNENRKLASRESDECKSVVKKSEGSYTLLKLNLQEINSSVTEMRTALNRFGAITKPEENAELRVMEEQIESLKGQATRVIKDLAGPSPYDQNIKDAIAEEIQQEADCRVQKDRITQAEKLIPYYSYWVNAFGDNGIRKFVIDGIIPALNSRISHWLHCLIYGNIALTFDNTLKETINRVPFDGEEFVYNAMSGGEQRRINLAVTLSFAHIMMLNSGRSPNMINLDEVAINIDENGIEGVYNMILELSREKKVFVTTHDTLLIDLLKGCDVLQLERRNGFTKRV